MAHRPAHVQHAAERNAVCGVGPTDALAPHLEPRGVYFFLALLDRRVGHLRAREEGQIC